MELVAAICYLTRSLPTRYPLHGQHVLAVKMSDEIPFYKLSNGYKKTLAIGQVPLTDAIDLLKL